MRRRALIFSCIQNTLLIEKKIVSKLKCTEKLALKIHLLICPNCKKYAHDSQIIEKIMQLINQDKMLNNNALQQLYPLPPHIKKMLQKKILQ